MTSAPPPAPSDDDLPTVAVDGVAWTVTLLHEHKGEREFTESDLSALIEALSPEQRERVIGPYFIEVITSRSQMRDNWNAACDVLELRTKELAEALANCAHNGKVAEDWRKAAEINAVKKLEAERERDEARAERDAGRADREDAKAVIEALAFYADPASYFAIAFFHDPPTGDFAEDFSETELGWKPGKRAREAIDRQLAATDAARSGEPKQEPGGTK